MLVIYGNLWGENSKGLCQKVEFFLDHCYLCEKYQVLDTVNFLLDIGICCPSFKIKLDLSIDLIKEKLMMCGAISNCRVWDGKLCDSGFISFGKI